MEQIWFSGERYPAFTANGFAARFAFPFAKEVCNGVGYDIGCNRLEWCLPGAIPIDPELDYDTKEMDEHCEELLQHPLTMEEIYRHHEAMYLPNHTVDYIFSSHCLEHLPNWVAALNYWQTKLKPGGILFLYLPSYKQGYWRPWHNRKHIHVLQPAILADYFTETPGWTNLYISGVDLNYSFTVIVERV